MNKLFIPIYIKELRAIFNESNLLPVLESQTSLLVGKDGVYGLKLKSEPTFQYSEGNSLHGEPDKLKMEVEFLLDFDED